MKEGHAISYPVIRKDTSEKVVFEQRPEGMSHADDWSWR
jgi:hypothetical protein